MSEQLNTNSDKKTPLEHIAELRKVIGGEFDPMRRIWDEEASDRDRRLLLALAKKPRYMRGHRWTELAGEVRADIKHSLRTLRGWADRISGDEAMQTKKAA